MSRPNDRPEKNPTAPSAPSQDEVDEASQESFPASDPPSWDPLHTGSPEPSREKAQPPRRSDG